MLPRRSRLPHRGFRLWGRLGQYQVVTTKFFSLKAKENHKKENRIGVIAGAAVHKSAVRRNFWKRQAKATLVNLKDGGYDFLVTIFHNVNTLDKKEFREILLGATARLERTKKT